MESLRFKAINDLTSSQNGKELGTFNQNHCHFQRERIYAEGGQGIFK